MGSEYITITKNNIKQLVLADPMFRVICTEDVRVRGDLDAYRVTATEAEAIRAKLSTREEFYVRDDGAVVFVPGHRLYRTADGKDRMQAVVLFDRGDTWIFNSHYFHMGVAS